MHHLHGERPTPPHPMGCCCCSWEDGCFVGVRCGRLRLGAGAAPVAGADDIGFPGAGPAGPNEAEMVGASCCRDIFDTVISAMMV